jgi:excisionase family DNA binding protein
MNNKEQGTMDDFMTVKDVCGLLKVSRGTVIRLIRGGQLTAFKLGAGRSWRVTRSALQKFARGGAAFRVEFGDNKARRGVESKRGLPSPRVVRGKRG